MLVDVIKGISIKLNSVFGAGYTIYTESVAQGLKEPCFFIALLDKSQQQVVGIRYLNTQPFDIHYFPSTLNKNTESYDVAEKLESALEYITLPNGDILRGTKIHSEMVDGVLHFFVNYDFHIYKIPDPSELMGTLTVESGTKG